jgi:hypothetical protein
LQQRADGFKKKRAAVGNNWIQLACMKKRVTFKNANASS